MHIFVINLPEDHERREAIEQQLNGLGLDYEIFPAVRGKALAEAERAASYDEVWHRRNEGRDATPGELGCALSHIGIYRLIQERGISHALVLEDDAWLNPNLPQLLAAIEAKKDPKRKEVILLTWFQSVRIKGFDTLWSCYHSAEASSAVCTHGYVVSNAAAGAMLEVLFPVRHLVDCWNWLIRHRVITIRAIFPTCITADLSHESNLSGESRRSGNLLPFVPRMQRRAWRLFWLGFDRTMGMLHRLTRRV